MTTKTMNRAYKLTDEEGDKMKNQLLQEMDNNDYLTAEYERVKLEHRGVIKQSDELISTLRRNIKSGTKEVEIEVTYNKPEAGKKTIKRTDTGEEVVEEMHQAECDEFPPTIFSNYEVENEEPKNVYDLAQLPEANIEPEEKKHKFEVGTRVIVSYYSDSEMATITKQLPLIDEDEMFSYEVKLDLPKYGGDDCMRNVYEHDLIEYVEESKTTNEAV